MCKSQNLPEQLTTPVLNLPPLKLNPLLFVQTVLGPQNCFAEFFFERRPKNISTPRALKKSGLASGQNVFCWLNFKQRFDINPIYSFFGLQLSLLE